MVRARVLRHVSWAALLCALCAVSSASAQTALPGDEPSQRRVPASVAEVPDRSGSSDGAFQLGNIGRPTFMALIAGAFLAFCAVISANDKNKRPRSRRF